MILAAATVFTHTRVDRYEKTGPDLLTGQWMGRPPENSPSRRADVKENAIALFSDDPKAGVNIYQEISGLDPGTILEFFADMKCEDVKPGEKPWNRARLLLVQNDHKKDRWDIPHLVASLAGTLGWETYRVFFPIHPETKKIRVIAQLSQSTGLLELKHIRLYPVSQARVYTWIRDGLLFLWTAFSFLLIGSCFVMGQKRMVLRVLLVSALIAIVFGTTMPGEMRTQVLNDIKTWVNPEPHPGNSSPDQWDLSKIGHFCFFAVFGLILCLMMPMVAAFQVMIIILLLAGGTETAQFLIDGRTPLLGDFFIDAAGGFSGIMLIRSTPMNNQ